MKRFSVLYSAMVILANVYKLNGLMHQDIFIHLPLIPIALTDLHFTWYFNTEF